ncbi:MAG: Hsp70 family protein [Acidimicrobiia bacterium]
MKPIAYGIDFGTTNCSISVATGDGVQVLDLYPGGDMRGVLPSLVYLHRSGVRTAGMEAAASFMVTGGQRTSCQRCELAVFEADESYSDCKQFDPRGNCLDSRLIAGIKDELANQSFTHTHSWATDFALEDMAAVIFTDLRRRAGALGWDGTDRLVVGHPVAFVGAEGDGFEEQQALAEDRLMRAAHRAGFDEVVPVPEPVAAVMDEPLGDGVSVSVDFGGGTFDVAVLEVVGGEGEVKALDGAAIGGSFFDALIFDDKVSPEIGLHRDIGLKHRPVPAWFRHGLRSLSGVKELLSSRYTPGVLADMANTDPRQAALVDSILYSGQALDFYRAIEAAKIELSDSDRSSIEFHPPGLDLSIPFTRQELDILIDPSLDVIDARIAVALDVAGCSASDVTSVIRTGGSSQLAGFVERLDRTFGPEKVRSRDAYTSVAYGLGVIAMEMWA